MTPTNKLRFVEREAYRYENAEKTSAIVHTKRVLQQWWQSNNTINLGWTGDMPISEPQGEWRDVPLEAEQ